MSDNRDTIKHDLYPDKQITARVRVKPDASHLNKTQAMEGWGVRGGGGGGWLHVAC